MAAEPCPQCGAAWPEGQEVCPNCGFIRPPEGAQFRSGLTGVHQVPTQPPAAPPPAAPPPPQSPPPQSPAGPPAPPPTQQWSPQPSTTQQPWPPPQQGASPPPGQQWPPGPTTGSPRTRAGASPLAAIGAILVILGGVLPWFKFEWDLTGFKVPWSFLFGNVDANLSSAATSVGLGLVVVGVVALLLSVTPASSAIRRILGLVGIAAAVLFVVQPLTHDVSVGDLFGELGPGVYLALVGGLLLLLAPAPRTRTA